MKTIKKELALLFAIFCLCLMLGSCFNHDSNVGEDSSSVQQTSKFKPSEGFEYRLNDDGKSYAIIGNGTCDDKEMIIPETYRGLPITSIVDLDMWYTESLVLSDNIESIYADFGWQSALKNITFGTGLKYIDSNVFISCKSLEKVYVKDLGAWCNIEFDSEYANPMHITHHLYDTSGNIITELAIPNGTKQIGDNAFVYGTFESVSIPNSVTSIGKYAFMNCKKLKYIFIPNCVTKISEYAFQNCNNLEDVTIDSNNIFFENHIFDYCYNLKKITIGNPQNNFNDSIIEFDYNCQWGFDCDQLNTITFNVFNIDWYQGISLFRSCSQLTDAAC